MLKIDQTYEGAFLITSVPAGLKVVNHYFIAKSCLNTCPVCRQIREEQRSK